MLTSHYFLQTQVDTSYPQNEEGSEEDEDAPSIDSPMPTDVPWLNYAFPFTSTVSKTAEGLRGSIISLLPRASLAKKICEIYYRHAAWMCVTRPPLLFLT